MGRALSSNPLTRTSTFLHEEEGVIHSVQDVEAIIDLNKAQYNATDHRTPWHRSKDNHVARIPLVVYFDLVRKGVIAPGGDSKPFERWLDDPDNRFFRVRPGRVSR